MKKLNTLLNITLAIFVIAVAISPSPALAGSRHRAGTKLEKVKGVVIQATAQFLTVRTAKGDRDVRIPSDLAVSRINIGDKVEIQVRKAADGTLIAVSVEVDENDEAKEIEGVVRLVSPTSITITTPKGDVTVAVTADTKFLINDRSASLSSVVTGVRVEVKALRRADGTLAALTVKIESRPVEIEGLVSAVSATSITVRKRDGTEVAINLTSTTIVRRRGILVSTGAITVGMQVEVEAVRNADRSLTALLIEAHDEDELAELKGTVLSIGSDQLRIKTRSGDEVIVMITADTIIRIEDRRVTLSDIKVGDQVEIEAQQNINGTFTAVRIEIDEDNHLVEIEGLIKEITGSTLTIRTEHGDLIKVNVGAGTKIRRGDASIPASELQVGQKVEVKAQRNADGSLLAVEIRLEDENENELVEIRGTVTAVDLPRITVAGVVVIVNATTTIMAHDRPGAIADIQVGRRVEIKARRGADGTLVAVTIKIEEGEH